MSKKLEWAKCHPDRPNHYWGKCKECYVEHVDPNVPCPHTDRPKDRHGRCSTCMSKYYSQRRKRGVGDRFGTARSTESRDALGKLGRLTSDPVELKTLVRRKRLASNYGISLTRYLELLVQQNGVCAICGNPPKPGRELVIDHDHNCCAMGKRSCGKCVRGLLCHGCNLAVGHIESINFSSAVDYLKRFDNRWDGKKKEWESLKKQNDLRTMIDKMRTATRSMITPEQRLYGAQPSPTN